MPDTCSHWIPLVCRGRRNEMQVRTHIQPPLQRLDSRPVGQSRTDTRGDTGPQPPLCIATPLKRGSLPSGTCRLS